MKGKEGTLRPERFTWEPNQIKRVVIEPVQTDDEISTKSTSFTQYIGQMLTNIGAKAVHIFMPDTKAKTYKVQPFHSNFPLADENAKWKFSARDGNAIIDLGGWDLYKRAHLVVDTTEGATPENKAAYIYPVAKLVDGKLTYFLRAAQTVYAGLQGGARKADLPEGIDKKVMNTIKKIYKKFDHGTEQMGEKIGRFVKLDDGRTIFIGGPGQGGGGSGGGGTPATAAMLAQALADEAQSVEPQITQVISGIVDETGGEMEGLDFRLKGKESIIRKIKSDAQDCECPEEEVAGQLNDLIRYTAVFDPADLVAGVEKTQAALEGEGWERYDHKWKNYFVSEGPYRGYNSVYTNGKQTFELQFHTPASLEIKEKVHSLYEQARILPKGPERTRLNQQMTQLWEGFENPAGAERLPGVQMP